MPAWRTVVTISDGQTVTNVNASMVEGGMISGRVTNRSGENLAGIRVATLMPNVSSLDVNLDLRTDEDGNYLIRGLTPGVYSLRFSAPDSSYITAFYNESGDTDVASDVVVVAGERTRNIDVVMCKWNERRTHSVYLPFFVRD